MMGFYRGMQGMMTWMHSGWFGITGILFALTLITAAAVFAVWAVRRTGGRHNSNANILKERLAKGEIDEQMYDSLLKRTV